MFEQGTSTFLDSLKELGPFVVVLVLLGVSAGWIILGLFKDAIAAKDKAQEARVADALVFANTMKSIAEAMSALTTELAKSTMTGQSVQQELARLTTEIARGSRGQG